jgi:hypothetical protein
MGFGENHVIEPGNLVQARGYTVSAISGLLTTVAANGLVFGLRNVATDVEGIPGKSGSRAVTEALIVTGVRVRFAPVTAFGAAQGLIFRGYKVSGFTGIQDTGGTAVRAHYKRVGNVRGAGSYRAPLTDISAYISTTGAITGGTFTAPTAGEPEFVAVAAGALQPAIVETIEPGALWLSQPLEKDDGLVIDCGITMGASGTGYLFVDVECHRPNIG